VNEYLIAFAVIFALNLLPAFGPPTWSVLVLFTINSDLSPPAIVAVGAGAAALGRFALANATRHLRSRFSPKRRESLAALSDAVTAKRGHALAGLGLFALSPVPSAQLFVAAGLLDVRLVPLTLAFFAGRLVSYSLYVGAASIAAANFGEVVAESLTSPLGIGLKLLLLAVLVVLLRVDWPSWLARRATRSSPPPRQLPTQPGAQP
jgi:membrane protein YqaA with SNARE-associated domain